VCPARNLSSADSLRTSTETLVRSEGVMPKRAESETIWHMSELFSGADWEQDRFINRKGKKRRLRL
jgi:hypothetical protein